MPEEPKNLAATLEERARGQALSRRPPDSPVAAAQRAPISPLQREERERTRSFLRARGEDLHNTWKEGNELAQVGVARPPPAVQSPAYAPVRERAGRQRPLLPLTAAPAWGVPAQARQAANMACAPTTSSVLGWWTETSKNRKPSGLRTCRAYHTKKNGQTSFIEAEVSASTRTLVAA